jgi:hypothetical protein
MSVERGLGAVLAAAAMAGVVWASNAPMTAHRVPDAVLRLAWSARPERIETCRQQSTEELARLPQHMRQAVVCEGATAEYRLVVRYEGKVIADQVVRGGGLRQDRRLYVFQDLRVPAGDAAIDVRFHRRDHGDAAKDEVEPGKDDRGQSVPPRLSFERRLRFSPRRVILVTYDSDRRELVALQ